MPHHKRKITIIGDDTVGKTSLMLAYTSPSGTFDPSDFWLSDIFENYTHTTSHQSKTYKIAIWDTLCSDQYAAWRPLAYKETYIFLVCFSLVQRGTYENVRTKWYPEISRFDPLAKVVLVGTKLDLRLAQTRALSGSEVEGKGEDESKKWIEYEQGEALAKEIGAAGYWECSSLTGEGVKKLFE